MKGLIMVSKIKNSSFFLPTKTLVFVIVVSVISAILFAHIYDVSVLAVWWTTLLDCIRDGNFSEYQHVLAMSNLETNYPLFLNIISSLWILPLYIIVNIFHIESHLWLYILWIKVLLIITNLGIAKIIQLILNHNGVSKNKQTCISLIFLLSPFVQFYSIGMGQIDSLGLLFAMLGFLSIQKELYVRFIIYSVISILLKPFVVFIIVPLLIYAWYKNRKISIISIITIPCVYLLHEWLSEILVYDYSRGAKFWSTFVFYPRLMEWTIFNIPIVLILIALVCILFLVWGKFKALTTYDVLLCQTILLVIFETLVRQHPQWFIYFAVSSIMLMAFCNKSKITYFIYLFLEIVYCLCGIVFFDEGNIITSYGEAGLIGKTLTYNGFNAGEFFGGIIPDIATISIILLSVTSIVYIISVVLLHRNYNSKIEDENTHPLLTTMLSFLPSLFLTVFVVIGYII